jgi:hypothetical protein
MKNKNLVIGASVLAVGLLLANRAVKNGKNVPVIGGLFKKPSASTEESEKADTEASLEESGANFSSAEGVMPRGYATDCFTSSLGEKCCYNKSKTNISCTQGAAAVRVNPIDRLVQRGRKSYSSRPERPSTRRGMKMATRA